MTTTQSNVTTCPQCDAADSIDLAGGLRLCLQCRNEWNPRDVKPKPVAPVVVSPPPDEDATRVAAILAAGDAEDVLTPYLIDLATGDQLHVDEDDDYAMAGYLGTWCVDEDTDEVWLCIGTNSSGTVDLQKANGKVRVGVDPSGVVWIAEADLHLYGVTSDTDDDSGPMVNVIATIASLVLTTGVASIADDEDRTLLNPPTGWLPPPASDIPEAEQGAAYAVAILVRTFNLDTEAVLTIAQSLMAGASASTTESE